MTIRLRHLAVLILILGVAGTMGWANEPPPSPSATRSPAVAEALLMGRAFLMASDWAVGGLPCPLPLFVGQPVSSGESASHAGAGGYSRIGSSSGRSGSLENQAYRTRSLDLSTALTAAGVPNHQGRLVWPLGLRILPPAPQTRELRDQLDAQLKMLMAMSLSGQDDSHTVRAARQAVDKLYGLLKDQRYVLATATYEDASHFIKNLQKALASVPAY
jgi:hypothetical protein